MIGIFDLDLGAVAPWSTPQAALILEQMRRVLVDGPVVPLSRLAYAHAFGKFLEALVQAEIVTHRVFPAHIRSSEEFIAARKRNKAKLVLNTFLS